jgi:putative transposase
MFGPQIARKLQRCKAPPSPRWRLDKLVCNVGGERVYLWRAVDDEGAVLDLVGQKRRNAGAALKLLKSLLRNQGVDPESFVTDCKKSCGSALRVPNLEERHRPGRLRDNSRAENSHLPIRRRARKMQGFRSTPSAQRFLTPHAVICHAVDFWSHMISRPTLRLFRARADSIWAKAAA